MLTFVTINNIINVINEKDYGYDNYRQQLQRAVGIR